MRSIDDFEKNTKLENKSSLLEYQNFFILLSLFLLSQTCIYPCLYEVFISFDIQICFKFMIK